LPLPLLSAVAIAVAIAFCCYDCRRFRCCRYLLPRLLSLVPLLFVFVCCRCFFVVIP
jgi:hypothetical protein